MTPWTVAIANAFLVCLLSGTVLLVLFLLMERRCRFARDQRTHWRTALALYLLMFMIEATGLNHWRLSSTFQGETTPQSVLLSPTHSSANQPMSLPVMEFRGTSASFDVSLLWYVLGILWLAGTLFLFLRLLMVHLLLFRWRCQLLPIQDQQLAYEIDRLARGIGVRIRVGQRIQVDAPFVFGIWRPTLILPLHFPLSVTASQREAVLRHELTHLAQRDPAWQLLAELLCIVHWWHPAVWLMKRYWQEATEFAADEEVAQTTFDALPMAESLLAWQRAMQTHWGLSIASRSPSLLGKRIRRLLTTHSSVEAPASFWFQFGVRTSLLTLTMMMVMIAVSYARFSTDKEKETMLSMQAIRRSLLGLTLLGAMDSSLPAQGAVQQPAGAPKSVSAAGKSEEGAMLAMGLVEKETAKLRELLSERKKQTDAYHAMPSGQEKSKVGKEIGEGYRASLQLLLSPEQYSRYLEYWEFNNVVIKHGEKNNYSVLVTAHPFDTVADSLTRSLKLSKDQQKKLANLSEDLKKRLSRINQLVANPSNLSEVNSIIASTQRQRNDRLKEILGAEAYSQYRMYLNELITASWNRTTAARTTAGAGFAAPIK